MQTSDENKGKKYIIGLLIDLIPNSPNKHNENLRQTVRRMGNEILGVKGLIHN